MCGIGKLQTFFSHFYWCVINIIFVHDQKALKLTKIEVKLNRDKKMKTFYDFMALSLDKVTNFTIFLIPFI